MVTLDQYRAASENSRKAILELALGGEFTRGQAAKAIDSPQGSNRVQPHLKKLEAVSLLRKVRRGVYALRRPAGEEVLQILDGQPFVPVRGRIKPQTHLGVAVLAHLTEETADLLARPGEPLDVVAELMSSVFTRVGPEQARLFEISRLR